jgi:hypothetical protein
LRAAVSKCARPQRSGVEPKRRRNTSKRRPLEWNVEAHRREHRGELGPHLDLGGDAHSGHALRGVRALHRQIRLSFATDPLAGRFSWLLGRFARSSESVVLGTIGLTWLTGIFGLASTRGWWALAIWAVAGLPLAAIIAMLVAAYLEPWWLSWGFVRHRGRATAIARRSELDALAKGQLARVSGRVRAESTVPSLLGDDRCVYRRTTVRPTSDGARKLRRSSPDALEALADFVLELETHERIVVRVDGMQAISAPRCSDTVDGAAGSELWSRCLAQRGVAQGPRDPSR